MKSDLGQLQALRATLSHKADEDLVPLTAKFLRDLVDDHTELGDARTTIAALRVDIGDATARTKRLIGELEQLTQLFGGE